MESYNSAINYAAYGNGYSVPGQSSNTGGMRPVKMDDRMTATWDHLRIQVNLFNKIISIPAAWFKGWPPAVKNAFLAQMRYVPIKFSFQLFNFNLTHPMTICKFRSLPTIPTSPYPCAHPFLPLHMMQHKQYFSVPSCLKHMKYYESQFYK